MAKKRSKVPPQLRPYLFKKGHRRRRKNPGRAVHTAKFDRCVSDVSRRRRGKKARNAFAVCTARLGGKAFRKRRKNPSRYGRAGHRDMYMITAQRPGGELLKLVRGNKFSATGQPLHFPVKSEAEATKRWLRREFKVLRSYTMHVTCCA